MRASGGVFKGVWTLALLISGIATARNPANDSCGSRPRNIAALSQGGIRAVVLDDGEVEPAALRRLRDLGVNTVVTGSRPNLTTAELLDGAGLSYIAYISSEGALALANDREDLEEISLVARLDSFAGFHYLDESVPEGYTAIPVQQRTYAILKELFPEKLVLYPLRLDLIRIEEAFLDKYFDPRFTDLVTPYFYPVGTTPLGTFHSGDDWGSTLLALLGAVGERLSGGQGVLPVLQAFEHTGFTVDEEFPQRQIEIYESVWPRNRNAAAFAWGEGPEWAPLVGMAHAPALQTGFRSLFARLEEAKKERCRSPLPDEGLQAARKSLPRSFSAGRGLRLALTSFAGGAP